MKNLLTAVIILALMMITTTAIAGGPRGDLGGKIRSINLLENVSHKSVTTAEYKRSFFQMVTKVVTTKEKIVTKKTFVRMLFELKSDMGFTCQDIPLEKVRFRPIGSDELPHIDIFIAGSDSYCYDNFSICLNQENRRKHYLEYVVISIPEKFFPAEKIDISDIGSVK